MTTDKTHPEKPSRKPQILITGEQFVAAKRAIDDLFERRKAQNDLSRDYEVGADALEFERIHIDPLNDEIFQLYADVCASPPVNRQSALIKLSLAINPALGLDESDGPEFESLRQVSAFLDGGQQAYVPLPPGTTKLEKMIAVEDRIRSMGSRISDAADDFSFWLRQQDQSVQELAAGVDLDEIYRLYHKIDDGVPDDLRDQIDNTSPVSLAEAIALLEIDNPPLDAVIAGLRTIAEKGGVA